MASEVAGRARRRLAFLVAACTAAAALFVVPNARASDSGDVPQRLILDVTGWERQATGAPTPGVADGIGPGSYLLIEWNAAATGNGEPATFICTANFLWASSGTTYLGAAGHCFLPSPSEPLFPNAPDVEVEIGANPWINKVEVCVAGCAFGGQLGAILNGEFRELGPVVYARQFTDNRDNIDTQIGHDFGLVTVPSGLENLLRPAVPVWGGPTGSDSIGDMVCVYGNGTVVGETFASKSRAGVGLLQDEDSWWASVPTAGGDSGAAVINCPIGTGTTAVGILTHGLVVDGAPWAEGTTVGRAVEMVRNDWDRTITLVTAPPSASPLSPLPGH